MEQAESAKVAGSSGLNDLRDKIADIIEDIKSKRSDIVEKSEQHINIVEAIFNNPNTVHLEINPMVSELLVRKATAKEFPFHGKKNTFADALIFYQFIGYVGETNIKNAHFVTANREDFFPAGKLHEALNKELDKVGGHFHKSLGEALNQSLGRELVTLKERKWSEYLRQQEELEKIRGHCHHCTFDEDDAVTIYYNKTARVKDHREYSDPNQLSLFGDIEFSKRVSSAQEAECEACHTVHIKCPDCGATWAFHYDGYPQNEVQTCSECEHYFRYNSDESSSPFDIEIFEGYGECPICGENFDAVEENKLYCSKCGTLAIEEEEQVI